MSADPEPCPIQSTTHGAVGVLRIERSSRRNAMDGGFVDECTKALRRFEADPDIRAIVVDGRSPGFCAGSDLKFISPMTVEEICKFEAECGTLGRLIGYIPKPVISAVEGFAIGGGFTLATCCDIVVSSRTAKWSLPEVPIGWLTPWGIGPLVARVSAHKAKILCYCLETLSGEDAQELGVADLICDEGEAFDQAMQTAYKIAQFSPAAVAATKTFFAREIMKGAEMMDHAANDFFASNVVEPVAQDTFREFRRSS